MVRQTRNSNGTVHRMVADPPAVGGRRGAVTATVTPQRQREEGEDDDARQLRRDEPPARQAPPPARRRTARTVVDFDTEDDLRMALLSMSIQSREDCCEREGAEGRESADDRNDDSMEDPNNMDANMKMTSDDPRLAGLDWCLEDYDRENSIPAPTVQQELERLRNVRSFQMIEHDDQAPKASLNQLSKIAQRLFDVPICTINLMDLGRAWILSGQGVGDIRESGRKETWCSHTMRYKDDMMVVPDATKDWRFKDSPHVTGPFHLRFYASCPIISPEGFRVGTFCIMGCQEKPNGLTADERETLLDFSRSACQILVERRELNRQRQLLQATAHDLQAPFEGVQSCLSMIANNSNSNNKDNKIVQTATDMTQIMQGMCQEALAATAKISAENKVFTEEDYARAKSNHFHPPQGTGSGNSAAASITTDTTTTIHLKEFLQKLHSMIDPFPKQVPVIMVVDSKVPSRIQANPLQLLRISLNLLRDACATTARGHIEFRIVVRRAGIGTSGTTTTTSNSSSDHVALECQTTAAVASEEDLQKRAQTLFQHLEWSSQKCGGTDQHQFGYQTAANGTCSHGNCLWFSFPLVEATTTTAAAAPPVSSGIIDATAGRPLHRTANNDDGKSNNKRHNSEMSSRRGRQREEDMEYETAESTGKMGSLHAATTTTTNASSNSNDEKIDPIRCEPRQPKRIKTSH